VTPVTKHLLDQALELPGSERAELASSLFESLDQDPNDSDQDEAATQAAWNDAIRNRIEDLDSGTVTTIPWSVARRIIRGEQPNESSGS
jgi:putative addiction module component (TIGR02574 family)